MIGVDVRKSLYQTGSLNKVLGPNVCLQTIEVCKNTHPLQSKILKYVRL